MDLVDMKVLPVLRSARWISNRPVLGEFVLPVQLLDVHEMVASTGDGPSTYNPLYRTIAVFPVGPRVPDFEMDPLGFADRSVGGRLETYPDLPPKHRKWLALATRLMARTLGPLFGVAHATFTCVPGAPEEEVLKNFGKNYLLQLGEACWVGEGAEMGLAPGIEDVFRGAFHRAAIDFFAATPGWIVQSAGGWLALWHEDRILAEDELPQFLRETWQVYDVLLNNDSDVLPGLRLMASPRRVETQMARVIATIIGGAAGFVVTGLAQFGLWVFGNAGPPSLLLALGGAALGAFVGFRYLSRWLQSSLKKAGWAPNKPTGVE